MVFTEASCNILPHVVKGVRQHIAGLGRQDSAVSTTTHNARALLAANVEELMRAHPDLDTARKLAARAKWPASAGPKRRGKPLSERYIRYVLNPTAEAQHSPSLDVLTAIAEAFKTEPWRLLVNDKTLRLWALGKLFSNDEAVPDQHVEKHLPLPPSAKRGARK